MRPLSQSFFPAFILCVVFAILFGYIVVSILNQSINTFDTTVIHFVQGMEIPWLTTIMKLFTWIGSLYTVAPISVIAFLLLYFVVHKRQQAFLLVTVMAGTVLLNNLLKIYFRRERPEIYRIINVNGFSFPSGHAMMALSLYVIIAFIAWHYVRTTSRRVLLLLFATFMIIAIGTSRIYLGVHYPSDVVGGIAASALWLTIVISVYSWHQNRRKHFSH